MSQHAWRLRATTAVSLALAASLLGGCANSGSAGEPTATPTGPTAARSTATSTGSPAAHVTTTATRVFAAYDSNGAPVAKVAARLSGACFTASITVSSITGSSGTGSSGTGSSPTAVPGHAYRCFTGSQILDPCFAAPRSAATSAPVRTLACYQDPWSAATLLTLTARLPADGSPLQITRPWAIELAGGRRCTVTTGTTDVVDGVAFGYRCDTGTAGLLTTAGRSLQALYRTPSGTLQKLHVAATWRA